LARLPATRGLASTSRAHGQPAAAATGANLDNHAPVTAIRNKHEGAINR
jgi:hypothetical protein